MMVTQAKEVLGSKVTIQLPQAYAHLFSSCFAELDRIEKSYSRFLDASELSMVNARLGSWQPVSDEFCMLLAQARSFAVATDGAFDITIKQDLDALGYDKNYSFKKTSVPTSFVHRLRSWVTKPMRIDTKHKRVFLRKEVDFGGFGKGYAVDRVAGLLEGQGVQHFLINAGGDIYAKRAAAADHWTVLLEHPDDPTRAIGELALDGRAIASSAANRRKWADGHHLINAKTKLPEHSVKAIFVVAATTVVADAYATALFTAGFARAQELYEQLPVEILVVSREGKMFLSDGFPAKIYN